MTLEREVISGYILVNLMRNEQTPVPARMNLAVNVYQRCLTCRCIWISLNQFVDVCEDSCQS